MATNDLEILARKLQEHIQGIGRGILEQDNGSLWQFALRVISGRCRRLRDEFSDSFCVEVEQGAASRLWESLLAKIKQFSTVESMAGRTADDWRRLVVASAARHATWRARRDAAHAMRFSESKGAVAEPTATDCPIGERPARGWTAAEFVGRIKTDDSAAGKRLAAQLKVCAILSASGATTRQIGEVLGVSHETARGRIKLLQEFLPGKQKPSEDDTEQSLAELEEQIGARFVRNTIARRKRAADESAEEERRSAELRHIGAGRRKLRGTVSAAEYLSGERSILRGGFRAPGLSRRAAELIAYRDARRVAKLLDGLRPIGGRVVDWQPIAESPPLADMLAKTAPVVVDREAAQSAYDAPRFMAAAQRMFNRIGERRAASLASAAE